MVCEGDACCIVREMRFLFLWSLALSLLGCSTRNRQPFNERANLEVADSSDSGRCGKNRLSTEPHAEHFTSQGRSEPPGPPLPDVLLPDEVRRRHAHAMMIRDPQDVELHHDHCGALVDVGSGESVPYLMHFLREHAHVVENEPLTCTLAHCLNALRRATGKTGDKDSVWREWLQQRIAATPKLPPSDPLKTPRGTSLELSWDYEEKLHVETERDSSGRAHGVWRFYGGDGMLQVVETYAEGVRTCRREVVTASSEARIDN